MIESSMMINDRMPEYCAERSTKILNRFKKSVNGSKVLILGVAYKQDIEDFRESPAIKVINELEKLGAIVNYYDPYISEYKEHGKIKSGLNELSAEILKNVDLVVVTTAHTKVDYDFVQHNSKFIFDTKNAMNKVKNRDNIELL
jgi:UDP-N-acetyl-D-glucosamine dehydrogenase